MILWFSAAFAAPSLRCDAAALDKVRAVLLEVEPRHHVELAATGLGEACQWPAGVGDALAMVAASPPERRTLVDAQITLASVDRLEKACAGGTRRMAELAAQTSGALRSGMYATCKPTFATEAEWTASSGLTATPILMAAWLAEVGVPAATVRTVVRALAGISDRAEDHPVREFQPLVR